MKNVKNWLRQKSSSKTKPASDSLESTSFDLRDFRTPVNGCSRRMFKHPLKKTHIQTTVALLSLVIAATISACTYKSPAVEELTPVDNADIPKSFFVKTEVDPKTRKSITVPKKFLCGWASEMEVGWSAEAFYTNNAIVPEHCNLVFEITEKKLIGKLINPSFPNDPSRWKVALTIPISSHHYVEREKDSAGRDKNEMVRNSSRSHWSARPNMELDLQGINLEGNYTSNEAWWGMQRLGNFNISKVDWDFKNGFLGFTIEKGTSEGNYARIRFNIKEFETNPNFKTTPFNDINYKKMNVLHIIGEKVNGIYPILNAAHWDVSKKIEIKLWEVPEKYKPLMEEVVSDWNEALRKAKATTLTEGPFVISKEPAKHAFDLRWPTIAWVADDKISTYSPLGIGMALADVKNGEIKWGMITLYTGYVEKYMKSYLEASSSSSSKVGKFVSSMLNTFKIPTNMDVPTGLKAVATKFYVPDAIADNLISILGIAKNPANFKNMKPEEAKKAAEESAANSAIFKSNLQKIASQAAGNSQNISSIIKNQADKVGISSVLNSQIFKKYANYADPSGKKLENLDAKTMEAELTEKFSRPYTCTERTLGDVLPGWTEALGKATENAGELANDEKVLRNLIKELTTHEFGHFIGLGHQFKENILPVKGTVPDEDYNKLAEKANEQNNYTNYTSVMGYRSPRVELKEKSDIKPGPHDLLVLRFLYNREYSTFKSGDKEFTFFEVPSDGIIPEFNPQKPEYKTSYFEQCNDVQASLSMDPLCNRFDAGYSATTIVHNYFADLNATLIPSLYAFTDARGGDFEEAEYRMWSRALSTLGRVRLFYDYMRKEFKPQIDQIRNSEEALMQFSSSCNLKSPAEVQNENLKKIFTESPRLWDYCRANALALREFTGLVSLQASDFTKLNSKGQFMPGGMSGGDAHRDWSRWLGSWEELGAFPLKYVSLLAVTGPSPWVTFGAGMYPHYEYSMKEHGYSYKYLYPRDYTKFIAANAKKNLTFASLGQDNETRMGSSVFVMSYLNWSAKYGDNEPARFPPRYVNKVRNQQDFNLGYVAVILKAVAREGGNPVNAVRWDGQVYDMATDRLIPLTSAYILPGGDVISNAPGMFLYPVTKFKPISAFEGYYFAYKVDYVRDTTDSLSDISVKTDLKDLYERLYNTCVRGAKGSENGLESFFSLEEKRFEGFKMGMSLERSEEKQKDFSESIDKAFKDYYSITGAKPETCQESLRGMGLIITSAASLSGHWLPEVFDYWQK